VRVEHENQVVGNVELKDDVGVSEQLGAPNVNEDLERSGRTVLARVNDRATRAVPAAPGLLAADPLEGGARVLGLTDPVGVQL